MLFMTPYQQSLCRCDSICNGWTK